MTVTSQPTGTGTGSTQLCYQLQVLLVVELNLNRHPGSILELEMPSLEALSASSHVAGARSEDVKLEWMLRLK